MQVSTIAVGLPGTPLLSAPLKEVELTEQLAEHQPADGTGESKGMPEHPPSGRLTDEEQREVGR